MSVGEVARRFGLATHVLRHWESVGLLKPARAGDRRRYDDKDLYRIAVIVRSKEAGLSLDGIREMFQNPAHGTRFSGVTRKNSRDASRPHRPRSR
ncbi:MerR family transcriptional regulator [Amycolatopsis sp. cmx-11-51]|uniref:MerR family transcriptional regulator n=1 Tax=Amycolatopsis sp. cmx-11-51 TaxID=2785797 RepID=UPI0039E70624